MPSPPQFIALYRESDPGAGQLALLDRLVSALGSPGPPDQPSVAVGVETVLTSLVLLQRGDDVTRAMYTHRLGPFTDSERAELARLEVGLRTLLREKCFVPPSAVEFLAPLAALIRTSLPFTIFTLNYDVVAEQFLRREGFSWTDGFGPRFDIGLLEGGGFEVRLVKLHGSIVWSQEGTTYRSFPVFFTGASSSARTLDGNPLSVAMVIPGEKEPAHGPYSALMDQFRKHLRTVEWLIIAGYSFRDQQVNQVLAEAIRVNTALKFLVVSESAPGRVHDGLLPLLGDQSLSDPGAGVDWRIVTVPTKWENLLPLVGQDGFLELLSTAFKEAQRSATESGGRISRAALKFLNGGALRQASVIPAEVVRRELDPTSFIEYLGVRAVSVTAYGDDPRAASAARAEFRAAISELLRARVRIEWGPRRESLTVEPDIPGGSSTLAQPLVNVRSARDRALSALGSSERGRRTQTELAGLFILVDHCLNLFGNGLMIADFARLHNGPGDSKGADRLSAILQPRLGHGLPLDEGGSEHLAEPDVAALISAWLDAQPS